MRLRGLPSSKALAAALLAGRLRVKRLGEGEVVLTTPKRLQATHERLEDFILGLGGVIEEYDAQGRRVRRRAVSKFGWTGQLLQTTDDAKHGRPPAPLEFRARDLIGSALAMDGRPAFRAFRAQWFAVLPAVTLRDVRDLQLFCRRFGISATRRPGIGDQQRHYITRRARDDRVGLLYHALAAHLRLMWPRCRYCKQPFAPRGKVRDCCASPACRRLRERERFHQRYRKPVFRQKVKQRVARWRRRKKVSARRTTRPSGR